MKMKCLILTVVILTMTAIGFGQDETKTPKQLAASVSKAFKARKLGTLDVGPSYAGRVKIIIEHSLADKSDVRSFTNMKLAGDWLFRGRREAGVNAGRVERCSKGTCTFIINGLLHNNLYLKKVVYGTSNGWTVIKAVHFVDGD